MNKEDKRSRTVEVGMTAFGYGKPENFSGYSTYYSFGLLEGSIFLNDYIFDTTSKYIKVPNYDIP